MSRGRIYLLYIYICIFNCKLKWFCKMINKLQSTYKRMISLATVYFLIWFAIPGCHLSVFSYRIASLIVQKNLHDVNIQGKMSFLLCRLKLTVSSIIDRSFHLEILREALLRAIDDIDSAFSRVTSQVASFSLGQSDLNLCYALS